MDTNWVNELLALRKASLSTGGEVPEAWADDVLAFWFDELEPADWFEKGNAIDAKIADRFLGLYRVLSEMPETALTPSPRQALAAVIVLDQFPRNLFRGDKLSFETDDKAKAVTVRAVDAGFDEALSVDERLFLYLPFEHSEDLADQDRALALITALNDEGYTKYALAHREVIQRFGRFPHRNAILGRASTPDEEAYLAQPGSGF